MVRIWYVGWIVIAGVFTLGKRIGTEDAAGIILVLTAGLLLGISLQFVFEGIEEWRGRRNETPLINDASVRLMWTDGVQFCGLYRARETMISTRLEPGGSPEKLDPMACVLRRIDMFGVVGAMDLIGWWHERLKRCPRDEQIVPLLVIFRRSPAIIIGQQEEDVAIEGNCGIDNRRIAFPGYGDAVHREFSFLAGNAQVDYNSEYLFNGNADSLNVIREDTEAYRADFRVGYSFNEGLEAEMRTGYQWKYLHNLFDRITYADTLVTRRDYFEKYRRECLEFARDVYDGYLSCIDTYNRLPSVLKRACPTIARKLDSYPALGTDPWVRLRDMLRYSIDSPDDDEGSVVGALRAWKGMEELVSMHEPHYSDVLQELGLFDELLRGKRLEAA